jgi:thiol-disulfide isomerase/thioredoxin
MKIAACFILATLLAAAQQQSPAAKEDQDLEQALMETGGSQVEYLRALEAHLNKYPFTARKDEIFQVLAKAAVELKDKPRILRYGVPALENGGKNLQLLDHVARALLETGEKANAERAARYAKSLAETLAGERKKLLESKSTDSGRGRRLDEIEYALARALLMQSRATGMTDTVGAALEFARKAWETYPSMEADLERAKWLESSGDVNGALEAAVEAFVIEDARAPAELRALARKRAGELATKAKGSEAAAGQLVLAAWDRVRQMRQERARRIAAFDPNFAASQPLDFTLPAIDGPAIAMSTLKGKVVVLDFWATWCRPCRTQHPLYEQVKKRFAENPDVVFLAVATDEERVSVTPFLESMNWSRKNVYYDDGLGMFLRVNSIPTTIVLDRTGAVFSRMNGYIADRFVDMLNDRIRGALESE